MTAGLLLDTHVLQWWWCSPGLLSDAVRERLVDGAQRVSVSAASWLELSVALRSTAPAPGLAELLRRFPQALAEEGFGCLPIQPSHLHRAGLLPEPCCGVHGEGLGGAEIWRCWVDRVLVAQARQEGLQLVSLDPAFAALEEPLLW
jgi:PIN domain nuclease of toxin-antitoxin system